MSLLEVLGLLKGDPLSPYHLASYLAYADQKAVTFYYLMDKVPTLSAR